MKIKKGIAILCALSICLTMGITSVFAQDVSADQDYSIFSYYEIAAGLVPGRKVVARRNSDNIVCVMRIYSDPSAAGSGSIFENTGHTFLTFLNASSSNITVGRHVVEPNKMISIGKFAKFEEFKGAFYNVEVNRKAKGWYTGVRSIYMELTASQLQTVSTYLKNAQAGYQLVGDNCACYAVKAWNSVLRINDDQYIDHFATPLVVYQDISDIGYYFDGNGLLKADYELCYYDGANRKTCKDYA